MGTYALTGSNSAPDGITGRLRPPIGKPPSFLDDKPVQRLGNTSDLKRVLSQLKEGKAGAAATLEDYLASVATEFGMLRIKKDNGVEYDEQVVDSVESFLPTRGELIGVVQAVARYMPTEENVTCISRFFEKLLPYFYPPEGVNSYVEWDFDNFKFIVEELFIYCVAIFLDAERFEHARALIETELYFPESRRYGEESMVSVAIMNNSIRSLEHRNSRLKLNRISLHSDLLHERNKQSPINFERFAQADIILYLSFVSKDQSWWPTTSLYLASTRATLPLFARAQSKKFFAKLRPVLSGDDIERFKARIKVIDDADGAPRWSHQRLRVGSLVGADLLGTKD